MSGGSRGRRIWRVVGYAAAGLVLLVVVLVVGTWLAVRAWGPELARERLETALSSALGRPTRVEGVSVEPWLGRVVISGVTAAALDGEPGPHFIKLARLEANVGLSSLWRRRLVLRSIRFDDADLRLRSGGGGALRELPLLPEVVRAGPIEIELGALELRRGQVSYDDPANSLRVQARGLAATLRPGRDAMATTVAAREVTLDLPQARERIETLDAAIRVTPTRLEISRLVGTWEGRRVTVAGRVDGPFDQPRLDLTAHGDVDAAAVGRKAGSAWALAGVVGVSARLEGAASGPRVTADVTFDDLTAGPVRARAGKAHATLVDGVLSLSRVEARAFDGAVKGSLVLELQHVERAHLILEARGVSIAALESLGRTKIGVTGRLDADLDARGDLRDPVHARSQIRVSARETRLPGQLAALGPGTVDAEARADRGVFDIARGASSWPGLKLDTRGRATVDGPATLHISATGEIARLAPLVGQSRAGGDAALEADLAGRWSDPTLTGRLELRTPFVADYRADAVVLPFELTRRSLSVTAASARLGRSRLTASGTAAWPATASPAVPSPETIRVDLAAQTDEARLEDAWPWLPAAARGSGPVRATAQLKGTLASWRVTGLASSSALAWPPPAPETRELSVTFDATPERLEVSALRTVVLDAPVTAKGRWRWAGGGEIEATTGAFDLTRLPGIPETMRIEGRARANVAAALRDGKITGSARLRGERLAVGGYALGAGTADVSVDDNSVKGELALPESRIAATAEGRLDGVVATRLTATDVDLGPLLRQARPEVFKNVGLRLSASATFDVPARDPRSARGLVHLEPVAIETGDEHWDARGPILIRREPGKLTLERMELVGRLGSATAAGWVDDAGTIEGTLRGQVPLALLAVLRREVREASGRLDLDVRVGGTTSKPNVLGRGTIAGGVVAVRDLPFVIRDMEGRIVLSAARVRIEELKANIGAGTVRVAGDAALDGASLGPYQLALTARGVGLTPVEGLDTVWNADLTVVGREARGVVRGEARLVRGSYSRDLSILPILMNSGARGEPAEWGREVALQVGVRLDDNLVVRSPQAQVRAGGSLSLQGTVAHPVVLGTIETQDGRITFRRHRFTLENVVVRFDDPRRINPYLDVRATTRIRTYDVTMWLSGRADDLRIRLSSEPPLPQEDLLALVTLGATRAELGTSGGLVFAGEAAQILSKELLGNDVSVPTVDVLEFGKNEAGEDQFRVGKRLNDRTLVTYTGSFAEGGKSKLRVEYQLLGPLLLAGEQEFNGGVGGDVILRLRFR
jgi:hypothetical protein